MVYYDSVHSGICRVQFNEQYLWAWFRKKNIKIDSSSTKIREMAYLVEGELNGWDWGGNRSLSLDELISRVYYKECQARKKRKISDS